MRRGELAAALQAPFVRPILRFPLKKVVIWGSILGLLYLLRQFFGVIFLTFVLTYIASTVVGRLEGVVGNRKVAVVLVYLLIVGAVVGIGFATIPEAVAGAKNQLEHLRRIEDPKAFLNQKVRAFLDSAPMLREWNLLDRLQDPELNAQVVALFKDWKEWGLKLVTFVLQSVWAGVLNVVLALIFSFMLVLDMPRIARSIEALERSRLRDVYREVAPSIATFFALLGRAFEAQTVIAIVNTALTCVGMAVLGIDKTGFLATIVFVCSFIPIVGVFISTVPICLVALQGGGGLGLVLAVIALVTGIHLVEAYILNPRIYGHHMKLHPLVVLVVLYIAQHTLGFWGLIVAVPVTTYVWRHVIMGDEADEGGAADADAPQGPVAEAST